MSEIFDSASRLFERLPRYLYVEELIRRRRVLELDFGDGAGCGFAHDLDARAVVGLDPDPDVVAEATGAHARPNLEFRAGRFDRLELDDGSFDLVVVPRGLKALGRGASGPDAPAAVEAALAEIRRVLRADGFLYVASSNPERRAVADVLAGREPGAGEPGYWGLYEALTAAFPHVKMIGQSPFVGCSLVEFAPENPDELAMSMDDSLMEESEDATTFLALCGRRPAPALDYALVQLPYFDLLRAVEARLEGAPRPAAGAARAAPGAAPAAVPLRAWSESAGYDAIVEDDEAAGAADQALAPPPALATLSPELWRALAAARSPDEVRRLRTREKVLRRAYAQLVNDAMTARTRARQAAREAGRERVRAGDAEARARAVAAEALKARETLSAVRLEKLGLEAEHRKAMQERDDRIGELLQKVVRLTQKGRDLEAKALDAKFATGNTERAQAAAAQAQAVAAAGEKRTRELEERVVALTRDNDGLRAALGEERSAPRRQTDRDVALRERDRRIAELAAEVQALEWRVEEAVGEAARLERALRGVRGGASPGGGAEPGSGAGPAPADRRSSF
ncbi:MAG TPA: methyltransferase domain-containing protein [Myxococcota bacterium]|jgi:SAM-dependent methyltransferase|nr:methyltransferase domain-containing protein [Myxococcota bacterium]